MFGMGYQQNTKTDKRIEISLAIREGSIPEICSLIRELYTNVFVLEIVFFLGIHGFTHVQIRK